MIDPSGKSTRRVGRVESLEDRRLLAGDSGMAASVGWDGPGLGSAEIGYHIAGELSDVSDQRIRDVVASVMRAFESIVDIQFVPRDSANLPRSIDIEFAAIDGRGGALVQTYRPDDVVDSMFAGDIQIDSSDDWEIGDAAGRGAFDLASGLVNGLATALGISVDPSDALSPHAAFDGLSEAYIDAALRLYAAAGSSGSGGDASGGNDDSNGGDSNGGDSVGGDADVRFDRRLWRRGGAFASLGSRIEATRSEHNYDLPTDVDGNRRTDANDAFEVIALLRSGLADRASIEELRGLADTDGNGRIEVVDVLRIINQIRRQGGDRIVDDGSGSSETGGGHSDDRPINATGRFITPILARWNADATIAAFDENGDGGLSLDELPLPSGVDAVVGPLMERLDADGDGIVTRDELDAVIEAARDEVFARHDRDGDGVWQRDEVPRRMWRSLVRSDVDVSGGVSRDQMGEIFDSRGLDRDANRIDVAETIVAMIRRLGSLDIDRVMERLDADRDGAIDGDELLGPVSGRLAGLGLDASWIPSLSRDEISGVLAMIPAALLDAMDRNGDGLIGATDIGSLPYFLLAGDDANRDGGLDLDEFTVALNRLADQLAREGDNGFIGRTMVQLIRRFV